MKTLSACIALPLLLSLCSTSLSAEYIWWEGEDAIETNFPKSTWFSTGALSGKRNLLSNNAWLANEGNRVGEEAFAKYNVTVSKAGEYGLWVRKFWKHGPFRWRFGDAEWKTVGRDIALADSVEIVTHLSANWIYAGNVSLSEGENQFELRLLAEKGESLTACFDAFLLTQFPFVPRGALKPNEKSGLADEGFFPWEPDLDSFADDALLDLRSLNENEAGMNGFVQKDNDQFILGNGEPVRFWAVNVSSEIAGLNRQSVKVLARSLAKRGVNMVRFHSPMFDRDDVMKLDQTKLDNLHFLIHAMKQEGIYTKASFYFPLWFSIQTSYGIPGYENASNKIPFALLYFNGRMQEIYRSWARELLTSKNPYTGKPIGQDPAVSIVEIINEDSFFFWTFTKNNIPPMHWNELETQYGAWLIQQYGTLDQAFRAWGSARLESDDASAGQAGLYDAWHMTTDAVNQANAGKKKRVGDQVAFLTQLQYDFYANTKSYFQNELNAKNLISASNWHVTDSNMLGALERHTYTAGDVIDRHGYFGGEHSSDDGRHSYTVAVGHAFSNRAATTAPEQLPLQFIQIENHPHIISEIGWTNPNRFRADYAFLASAYGALQGIDGIFTFAVGGAAWDTSMNKFALSSPAILGNFPAYALLYRMGYVQEGKQVIRQTLRYDDLIALKGSGDFEAQALDIFRQNDVPPGEAARHPVSGFDPLAFFVGPVARTFDSNAGDSYETNLSSFINREAQIVQSQSGELVWDYGKGIAAIETPWVNAAAGYLQNNPVAFKSCVIQCGNEHAAVAVVSLDGKPIAASEKLLIQAMTVERPFGFRASQGDHGTITDMGGYPFGVEKISATVEFAIPDASSAKVIALDENGYATDKPVKTRVSESGDQLTVQLNESAIYHILQRSMKTAVNEWSITSKN